jgi:hypothetical protein
MMKFLTAKKYGLLMMPLFFIGSSAWALDEGGTANKAMRALKKSDRDAAVQMLEKALTERPDSPFLNYHAGLVRYDDGDYDKAKEHFAKALALRERKDEARANYNAGNSLFQGAKGVRATDTEQALELLKEALNYYGRAIELNNTDKDASYNYELTSRVIKVIKELIPPPMSMPQGGGASEEEEKEEEKEQQQQQQKQKQQKQEKQEEQEKKEQEEQQQNEPSGGPPEPDETEEEPKEKQAQAPHKEDLTEEEARMLVATYGQEGPRLDINKDEHARDPKVLKNW